MVEYIAEMGINYNGDVERACDLVVKAKNAGASVFKTQFYSATSLFGPEGQTPSEDIFEAVKWMDDITFDDAKRMKGTADARGIEFMASAFDEERLGWLEELGVKRHKIASRSVKYQPEYCEQVLAMGKETFVSLGMWEPKSREDAGLPFSQFANARYLWCVSEYPTPYRRIGAMPTTFTNRVIGFSDHTVGIGAALLAIGRGAQVIEKHFTRSRRLSGPDQVLSLDPHEFNQLVIHGNMIAEVVEAK